MRTRTMGAIAALLVALTAQTAAVAQQPAAPHGATVVAAPTHYVDCCDTGCGGHCWVRGEALWWWTRGLSLPPLVTTSPLGTPDFLAGVLGEPETTVLFGDERVNDEGRFGVRLSAGYWFDCNRSCGIEGSIFWLDEEETNFSAASNEFGEPIIARPFFDIEQGVQNSLLVSFPGLVAGAIDISVSTKFHGAEIYLRKNCYDCCGCRVDVLGGFKYLGLEDELRINDLEVDIDPESGTFGTVFQLSDQFDTENRFYGGLIGVAVETCHGCWTLEAIAAVALGVTRKEVEINGSTIITTQDPELGPISEVFPGAFLALPSNIGSYSETDFGVVPELHINVSYQICDCLRATAGYTLIYWHDVARPGDQIDLGIEPGQFPPAEPNGFTRPAFSMRDTNFWVQGVSLGLELRY